MTRLLNQIDIGKPPEVVFAYVTNPSNWVQWHPSTVRVDSSADHSLAKGEQVVEEIAVAWQRGQVTWTVQDHERPVRWVIEGHADRGGHATLTYRLTAVGEGTRFTRELQYHMPNRVMALFDFLIVRHLMAATSAQALARLKHVLEAR